MLVFFLIKMKAIKKTEQRCCVISNQVPTCFETNHHSNESFAWVPVKFHSVETLHTLGMKLILVCVAISILVS